MTTKVKSYRREIDNFLLKEVSSVVVAWTRRQLANTKGKGREVEGGRERGRERMRQTDRQTDRHRQTDRQTDRGRG